jgi:hypothetical protein
VKCTDTCFARLAEPEEEGALRKFFLLKHACAPHVRAGPSQDESSEDDDAMLGGGYPNLDAPLQANACVPSHGGPHSTFVAFIPLHFRFLGCALLIYLRSLRCVCPYPEAPSTQPGVRHHAVFSSSKFPVLKPLKKFRSHSHVWVFWPSRLLPERIYRSCGTDMGLIWG